VDDDSRLYRYLRLQLVEFMRPIVRFLNNLDAEIGLTGVSTPLTTAVEEAKLSTIPFNAAPASFVGPDPVKRTPAERRGRISYTRPKQLIDELKKTLDVATNAEVGERTFEYFVDREVQDA
jgi:hypothetical protein